MRVIAGKYKGRSLKAVPGTNTRPTTDKVKESIFNMIGPYFDGGMGLDLFAGSGGLGIEALSRGMNKVIFIDRDRKAYQVIKHNIALCALEKQAEVYCNDAMRALKALIHRKLQFTHIFLDPPYKLEQLETIIATIDREHLMLNEGVIVAEHHADFHLPNIIGKLSCKKRVKYGNTTAITIWKYE